MQNIRLACFDLDNTLTPATRFFRQSENAFKQLLLDASINQTIISEMEKWFPEVTGGLMAETNHYGPEIQGAAYVWLLEAFNVPITSFIRDGLNTNAEELRSHPIEFYDGVPALMASIRDMGVKIAIVTKGDEAHQTEKYQKLDLLLTKVLGANPISLPYICNAKTPDYYARVFNKEGVHASDALMIGDSLKDDVENARKAGAHALYIKHSMCETETWKHDLRHDVQPDATSLPQLYEEIKKVVYPHHDHESDYLPHAHLGF